MARRCRGYGIERLPGARWLVARHLLAVTLIPSLMATAGCKERVEDTNEKPGAPVANRLRELEDFGVLATFGVGDIGTDSALLHKPIDGVLSDGSVWILDASPPWVRRYSRTGAFVDAFVRVGEGPGEAMRPMSLSVTPDGRIILGHMTGVEIFDDSGGVLQSLRWLARVVTGAVGFCGQYLGVFAYLDTPFTSALLLVDRSGNVVDTLMTVADRRERSRDFHAWMRSPSHEGLVFYPEEVARDRLIELDCNGAVIGEILVDSLGRERQVTGDGGGFLVRSPAPPYPSGLARIGSRILWSTREVTPQADSVTVVRLYDNGRKTQIVLRGWYQLFDGDEQGVLFGDSWTIGMNWRFGGTSRGEPAAYLVDTERLLRALQAS